LAEGARKGKRCVSGDKNNKKGPERTRLVAKGEKGLKRRRGGGPGLTGNVRIQLFNKKRY